jgi:hypothetical protein
MLKWILVVAVMAFASCQSLALSPAPYENTIRAASTADTSWMETEMNGVRLEMRMPAGWAADIQHGLLLAEHTSSTDTGEVALTVLIHVFVPPLDDFQLSQEDDENAAFAVLHQAVTMPSVIGRNVVVSEPIAFIWDGQDAAYYLLTNHDGAKAIVIAVEISPEGRVVVCNVSMPPSEESRVREMLPEVLDGLRINGVVMDGMALEFLPDPLVFPVYNGRTRATPSVIQ